jgi:glucose/arabinose dehydrogenase
MGTLRHDRSGIFFAFAVYWLAAATSQTAFAAISGTTRVATGLLNPVFATYAPGDSNHLFVVQKGGVIKVLDLTTNTVLATPFLAIPDTDQANEGGLLGLAFDPNYASPGTTGYKKFYTYVTVDNGGVLVPGNSAGSNTAVSPFSTHIRQYSRSGLPYVADTSATEIMSWPRPEDNHVGGWIGFGPKDGYLYIDSGDGGLANDSGGGHFEPGGNAQNITDSPNYFMGKQLRIDVHGDAFPADTNQNYAIPQTNPFVGTTGADEIWSLGLRNPYRAGFDRDTGDMWIGDVGQDTREEIDVQPASSTGGANYGWRLREGNIATPTGGVGGPPPAGYVAPVYDYTHGSGSLQGNAVIGGYVYRGPDPSVQGVYFFADETSSHKWQMNTTTFAVTNIDSMLTPNTGSVSNPSSFGEDAVGNLYIVSYSTGSVFRINTTQLLPGDYNADGSVNAADYTVWRDTLGQSVTAHSGADGDGSGVIDAGDYTLWTTNFGMSVHASSPGGGSAVPEPASALQVFQVLGACAIMGVCRVAARRTSAFPRLTPKLMSGWNA